MLTITVNDDRSITVESDDSNAENAIVSDKLEEAGLDEEASKWNEAEFDGTLSVLFEESSVKGVLEALEDEWPDLVDEAREVLTPHVGGGPKPKR